MISKEQRLKEFKDLMEFSGMSSMDETKRLGIPDLVLAAFTHGYDQGYQDGMNSSFEMTNKALDLLMKPSNEAPSM